MSFVNRLLKRVQQKIELSKYDDFSIGDYFKKQGAKIGKYNRIKVRCLGESPFLVTICDHCTISLDVLFLTHDGAGWIFTEELPSLQKFGTIQIMDNCFIGARAILLPNIRIGPSSVVGAGAVVTKDVPSGVVVAGNPARVISDVSTLKTKLISIWEQQKPRGYFADFIDEKMYLPEEIYRAKQRDWVLLEEHLKKIL